MIEGITSIVEQYELWFYVVLGVAAACYLRGVWRAQHLFRISVYGLERETASVARSRASSMLVIVIASASIVYITARHINPNLNLFVPPTATPVVILLTAEPTSTPDVVIVLPGQPTPTLEGTPRALLTSTPLPSGGIGCNNILATITSPLAGGVLSGVVEVQGVSNIPDFAFYVLEISTLGGNWLNIYTDNQPVDGGVLGQWDTGSHPQGDYNFRLVVYDASGAFAEPCTIPITVGGAQ